MWSEVSCCFWVPIWGLDNGMLGNFPSHIRVIFWQPHVGQEPASLYERQQKQQPHISHCADIHCVEFCLEVFPRRLQIKVRVLLYGQASLERSGCLSAFS